MRTNLSIYAQQRMLSGRGEPFFIAGWHDVVFLHFAVPPHSLQPWVPFELDVFNGMAYVSLVAFTMRGLRPRLGGAALFKPIATHEFLNVRTYVKHQGECGIYFLAEWLPNFLAVMLGPTVFGLPYRWGRQRYEHDPRHGFRGHVEDRWSGAVLSYSAADVKDVEPTTAAPGSLTEFLVERYTAFTRYAGWSRFFRAWHPPWPVVPINAHVHDLSLLNRTGDWCRDAKFVGAHYSPGFPEVWMGRPRLASSTHTQLQPHHAPAFHT
ncbi:MAG: DUF2071 domain-containing protein [Verrucomicrobiaceae bacterium]|nr:DUF2071 domain-containing protein [Verrucomicrobiaceae bacterium]